MAGRITRRSATQLLGAAAAAVCLPAWHADHAQLPAGTDRAAAHLPPEDDTLLDDLERRAALYFWEQTDPATGQILDRAKWKNTDGTLDPRKLASIAATGFGLSALCIADQRGYLPHARVLQRVRDTLTFHLKMHHVHGFLSHFNDVHTGEPAHGSEISSIDTSIFLCGVLTARAYLKDPVVTKLATALYERVDWPWMLDGGQAFSMGYRIDGRDGPGFIASRWSHYCELMMIYLLAIGSPTHPVEPAHWDSFSRPVMKFQGYSYISGADPLFVHQYSHAWFDFRGKRDRYADYFQNSVVATQAHKAFCLSLKLGYTDDFWGVSASDFPGGYTAWGGPPMLGPVDGSVVPYASAGSLPFLPAECMRVQRALSSRFRDACLGRYGFRDAFHPAKNWYDPDVLGIDLGIAMLMAENLRSGFLWQTFMANPEPGRAMKLCGFR